MGCHPNFYCKSHWYAHPNGSVFSPWSRSNTSKLPIDVLIIRSWAVVVMVYDTSNISWQPSSYISFEALKVIEVAFTITNTFVEFDRLVHPFPGFLIQQNLGPFVRHRSRLSFDLEFSTWKLFVYSLPHSSTSSTSLQTYYRETCLDFLLLSHPAHFPTEQHFEDLVTLK